MSNSILLSLLAGILDGVILWIGLRKRLPSLNRVHLVGLILGWTAAFIFSSQGNYHWNALAGAVGGLVTGLMISRAEKDIPKARLGIITIGWAASLFIGELVSLALLDNLDINPVIAAGVWLSVAGLIGSWVTIESIHQGPIRRPNWRSVQISALGFTIGMVGAYAILIQYPELIPALLALALWGFLRGAALGILSRNARKVALMGGAGAAGMLIGVLIWTLVAPGDPITSHGGDLLTHFDINPIIGLGFGLALGISTRRVSAALILALAGTAAFVLSAGITYVSGVYLLGGIVAEAIIGGVLGLAWGYLQNLDRESSS